MFLHTCFLFFSPITADFLNKIQILVSQKKKKFDKLQNAKTEAQYNCLLCFMGRIKVRLIEKMEK